MSLISYDCCPSHDRRVKDTWCYVSVLFIGLEIRICNRNVISSNMIKCFNMQSYFSL